MTETIVAKIKLSGSNDIREVCIKNGSTVGDLLEIAGIDPNCKVTCKNEPVQMEGLVVDDDIFDLVPEISVRIAVLGDYVRSVYLTEGSTIEEALKAAQIEDAREYDISCDSKPCNMEDKVTSGSIITLIPNIQGGQK